ncbi:hypothetical protein Tco_1132375 [Tanacetum coccineum]|uniref:Synaptobrevin, longin-like domain protein n=1 Tax=Tanacetum coccineum TaxID=301880 RepID=A0ABQ5JCB5_9ASTR
MVALKFASSHNMVAFLDKPTESDGFEQIATTKEKTVNGELQIHALVDKKKLTLMGYENLTQKLTFYKAFFSPQWKFLIHTIMQFLSAKTTTWNEFSSTMASAIICLATNQKFNFSKYIFDNMVKKLEGEVKFLMYPRFVQVFLDKQVEGMSKHKEIYITPSHTKKVFANMKRYGKDFFGRDTPLFPTMIVQAQEQVGLGDQEDASKQGRKINEINQDAEVTLVDETQGRYGDNLMFDTGVLDNEQDMAEKEVDMAEKDVSTIDPVTTAGEVVTTANVVTLIEIKAAKPKARGVIVQEPSEFTTTTSPSQPSQLPQAKDKGKAKMVEPEKPLKKKDQIMFDKEVAQKLQAQLDAELEEEEKLARQREEDANIAEWDNVQAMMDADYELAARLQAEEQGELTIEEKSRLFVELMNKRKKHFARLRAEEQRRKPPTKAQKRNTMSTYLKNMAGYKHNQLKTKSFEDIQMLFDKEMKRVNTFVDMDTELVKGSETRTKGSSKRAGEELESFEILK